MVHEVSFNKCVMRKNVLTRLVVWTWISSQQTSVEIDCATGVHKTRVVDIKMGQSEVWQKNKDLCEEEVKCNIVS